MSASFEGDLSIVAGSVKVIVLEFLCVFIDEHAQAFGRQSDENVAFMAFRGVTGTGADGCETLKRCQGLGHPAGLDAIRQLMCCSLVFPVRYDDLDWLRSTRENCSFANTFESDRSRKE